MTRKALRSEEHTSELQSHVNLVCRLLLEKKKNIVGQLGGRRKRVVNNAEDTTLHRFVALKFLPEELAIDSQAIERFKREVFFFNDPATTEIYTLSLHDALPIFASSGRGCVTGMSRGMRSCSSSSVADRKSTRLNSSHMSISYAVFCLKKKK